ncbi:sulfurtransferase TusA family protein [Bacillus carboniphilus]|uniref:Sulfurtransferase TusA family protein n=1 Tax=Bacillus carboniphilus TaxID=86663 RepID=A0ABY9JTE3_9BACI|nr:sulfurtransferase TusA family protein [Bacillus carboniphilus]WLR42649.1 sulfurtransferase TusA family protein [Bacillus carboniphilus]
MNSIKSDQLLDAKGLACPMPLVKTKKAIDQLQPGQVLEIQTTDVGSKADFQAWAKSAGHQYLGIREGGNVLTHFLRKKPNEQTNDSRHPHVIRNEEFEKKVEMNPDIFVLDVREPGEYERGHIPQALSIPLGELENRFNELNNQDQLYVVCQSGNRSNHACKILTNKGFEHVVNVVPGMSGWNGKVVFSK